METSIELCSIEEWLEKTMPVFGIPGLEKFYREANIFYCMQFTENEAKTKRIERTYSLKVMQESLPPRSVAWLTSYYISSEVVRIRGLYVLPEFQRRGLMSKLIQRVIADYRSNAKKIISFSYQSSIDWHLKNGFSIETKFKPRPFQYFDSTEKRYVDSKETFTLLFLDLL